MGEVTWYTGAVAPLVLEGYLQTGAKAPDAALFPPMPSALVDLLRHCFQQQANQRPRNMANVANKLLDIYQQEMGHAYHRRPAQAIGDTCADNLNNRAISLLELGQVDKAEQLWQQAIRLCPQYIEATFNLEVSRWRRGQWDDLALVVRLQDVCNSLANEWRPKYLLAFVHLERGDVESAIELLEVVAKQAPAESEISAALKLARSDTFPQYRCLRTLEGHTSSVTSVAIAPDGRHALSGSSDKTLKVWDIQTGRCLRTLQGHTSSVLSVAIAPDSRHALSGSSDKTLKVWEIQTGRCLHTLQGHTRDVNSVAITPDGRYALSGSSDQTLKVWDMQTGRCLHTLQGHRDRVNSVIISPDGRHALSSSSDETLRLWNISNGQARRIFSFSNIRVGGAASFSFDGRFCLSAPSFLSNDWHISDWEQQNSILHLWEVETGRHLRTFPTRQYEHYQGHTGFVTDVSLSLDGRHALSGSYDKTLKVWDMQTGRCLHTLKGHTSSVNSVAITPDGRHALSGSGGWNSKDNTLKVWQLPANRQQSASCRLARLWSYRDWAQAYQEQKSFLQAAQELLRKKDWQSAHTLLQSGRQQLTFQTSTWLFSTWRQLYPHSRKVSLRAAWLVHTLQGHTSRVNSVAIAPDGRHALSGSWDKTLKVWDIQTGRCLRTLQGHTKNVDSVTITPDGRHALSGSWDKTLKVWDIQTGRCLRTLQGHTKNVDSVAIAPDGRHALSGSGDHNTLKVWDMQTGHCLRTLGHTSYVKSVAIAPDGRHALSGSRDGTIKVWDIQTGGCLRTLQGHTSRVDSVAIASDGHFALSGSSDQTLKVWDIQTGRCLRTLQGHTRSVNSVAISPDGRFALSGSYDKTLKVWDMQTGHCLRTLQGHTDWVNSVAISPDGRYALSGSRDGTIKVWALEWELEVRAEADWDEGARPYLENFLTRQVPYAGTLPKDREPSEQEIQLALTRQGKPRWTEEEFQRLIRELQGAGYGWLRPEGVRVQLLRMVRRWQGGLLGI